MDDCPTSESLELLLRNMASKLNELEARIAELERREELRWIRAAGIVLEEERLQSTRVACIILGAWLSTAQKESDQCQLNPHQPPSEL